MNRRTACECLALGAVLLGSFKLGEILIGISTREALAHINFMRHDKEVQGGHVQKIEEIILKETPLGREIDGFVKLHSNVGFTVKPHLKGNKGEPASGLTYGYGGSIEIAAHSPDYYLNHLLSGVPYRASTVHHELTHHLFNSRLPYSSVGKLVADHEIKDHIDNLVREAIRLGSVIKVNPPIKFSYQQPTGSDQRFFDALNEYSKVYEGTEIKNQAQLESEFRGFFHDLVVFRNSMSDTHWLDQANAYFTFEDGSIDRLNGIVNYKKGIVNRLIREAKTDIGDGAGESLKRQLSEENSKVSQLAENVVDLVTRIHEIFYIKNGFTPKAHEFATAFIAEHIYFNERRQSYPFLTRAALNLQKEHGITNDQLRKIGDLRIGYLRNSLEIGSKIAREYLVKNFGII